MMTKLEERAAIWAKAWHAEQVRKYTGEPYAVHLEAVADLVRAVADPPMLAAAWMHDLIEDTDATFDWVLRKFGGDVAGMVLALTDCGHSYGNREKRKAFDRARLAKADWRVQTIKCADLMNNAASIVEHDPKFAAVFLEEAVLLLDVLDAALPAFRDHARQVLQSCREALDTQRLQSALQA